MGNSTANVIGSLQGDLAGRGVVVIVAMCNKWSTQSPVSCMKHFVQPSLCWFCLGLRFWFACRTDKQKLSGFRQIMALSWFASCCHELGIFRTVSSVSFLFSTVDAR